MISLKGYLNTDELKATTKEAGIAAAVAALGVYAYHAGEILPAAAASLATLVITAAARSLQRLGAGHDHPPIAPPPKPAVRISELDEAA